MGLGGAVDLPAIRQRIIVDDSALAGIGAKFGKVGKVLGASVAAGAGVAAAGIGAFVAVGTAGAIEVERGIAEVVTLFGATGEEARTLSDELSQGLAGLSDDVGIAQDVLVNGLYQSISAGVPKENAFEFLKVASQAAIAGVTDVETAVDGITTTVNAFGLDASSAQEVADSMFAAVQGGKTTFEELSSSLFQVAPAAAAAGISFEEVNAGIATLTSQGTPTAVATTRMRAAIDELAKPGTKVGETFEKVAGVSFREFIDQGGNLTDALGILQEHADETGAKIGDYFGSVEAAGAATSLAATGAEKMREELARQAGAAGAAGDAYETMNETTARSWERIKTQVQNAAIAVGSEILPVLAEVTGAVLDRVVPAIQTFAEWLGDLISRFRESGDTVGGLASTFGDTWSMIRSAFEEVWWAIRDVIDSMMGAFRRNESTVRETFETIRETVNTIIADVTAIITGVLEIISAAWDLFGDEIIATVRDAFTIIKAVVETVLGVIRGIIDVVLGVITGDWDRALGGLRRIISSVFEGIKTIVSTAMGAISRRMSAVWEAVKGATSTAWDRLKSVVRGKIDDAVGYVRDLPGRMLRAMGNVGRLLYNAGRKVLQGLIDGMWSKIQAIRDTINSVVSEIRNRLPFSPAKEGPLSGRGSPDRAGAKIGTMIASGLERQVGTVAAAANRVAAATLDPFSASVRPNVGLAGAAAAAGRLPGGGTYAPTIHVQTYDVEEAARRIGAETMRGMHLVPGGV